MSTVENRTDMAINTANAMLGAILIISPWLFGFRNAGWAAWNAWLSGGVVVVLALLAIAEAHDWEEWLNIIAGLWITFSPWLLFFEGVPSALWTHIVIGACIIAIAALEVCRLYLMPDNTASRSHSRSH
jgi:hypothetical protein